MGSSTSRRCAARGRPALRLAPSRRRGARAGGRPRQSVARNAPAPRPQVMARVQDLRRSLDTLVTDMAEGVSRRGRARTTAQMHGAPCTQRPWLAAAQRRRVLQHPKRQHTATSQLGGQGARPRAAGQPWRARRAEALAQHHPICPSRPAARRALGGVPGPARGHQRAAHAGARARGPAAAAVAGRRVLGAPAPATLAGPQRKAGGSAALRAPPACPPRGARRGAAAPCCRPTRRRPWSRRHALLAWAPRRSYRSCARCCGSTFPSQSLSTPPRRAARRGAE
jgi:hypothetical protein